MSNDRINNLPDGLSAVPLGTPPAYELKPEDNLDVERPAPKSTNWKRFLLSALLVILSLWLTMLVLNATGVRRYGVIYSSRYSKEHRFRPAASPIITETLADGRTRIRGAQPTRH